MIYFNRHQKTFSITLCKLSRPNEQMCLSISKVLCLCWKKLSKAFYSFWLVYNLLQKGKSNISTWYLKFNLLKPDFLMFSTLPIAQAKNLSHSSSSLSLKSTTNPAANIPSPAPQNDLESGCPSGPLLSKSAVTTLSLVWTAAIASSKLLLPSSSYSQ